MVPLETGKTGILKMREMVRRKLAEVRLPQAKNSPGSTRAGGGKESHPRGSVALQSEMEEDKLPKKLPKSSPVDLSSMSKV